MAGIVPRLRTGGPRQVCSLPDRDKKYRNVYVCLLRSMQRSSETHPARYSRSTGSSFLGYRALECEANHSPSYSAGVRNEGSCNSVPPCVCMTCTGTNLSCRKKSRSSQNKRRYINIRGFGGLGVACWPLVPKFAASNPAEAVGFLRGEKNPQHAFLRRGSKAVGPMS